MDKSNGDRTVKSGIQALPSELNFHPSSAKATARWFGSGLASYTRIEFSKTSTTYSLIAYTIGYLLFIELRILPGHSASANLNGSCPVLGDRTGGIWAPPVTMQLPILP